MKHFVKTLVTMAVGALAYNTGTKIYDRRHKSPQN